MNGERQIISRSCLNWACTYDVCQLKKIIFQVKEVAVCSELSSRFVWNHSVNYVVSLNNWSPTWMPTRLKAQPPSILRHSFNVMPGSVDFAVDSWGENDEGRLRSKKQHFVGGDEVRRFSVKDSFVHDRLLNSTLTVLKAPGGVSDHWWQYGAMIWWMGPCMFCFLSRALLLKAQRCIFTLKTTDQQMMAAKHHETISKHQGRRIH